MSGDDRDPGTEQALGTDACSVRAEKTPTPGLGDTPEILSPQNDAQSRGTVTLVKGDALALPIPDHSVDLVVTSPPYFAMRSYQDAGEHYAGQIGGEPTPAEFVDALIAATAEMVRVLKPTGSIWVNLGDKYVTKSLTGIPWRYAIRCIDDLGLILRAEVIWSKPNGLPESVRDRVRRSHEQWFHFTVRPQYYSAVDELRESLSTEWGSWDRKRGKRNVLPDGTPDGGMIDRHNPLGKLPGSVWSIPTQPLIVPKELGVDHFAAFPMEWPRRIITGWSPRGVCTACGEGRRPVGSVRPGPDRPGRVQGRSVDALLGGHGADGRAGSRRTSTVTITGETCSCPTPDAPTTPGVVLDPFGGTGTTAMVASALGRHGISVDLSADYCRLAEWRTNDPKQQARAARPTPVPRPRNAPSA